MIICLVCCDLSFKEKRKCNLYYKCKYDLCPVYLYINVMLVKVTNETKIQSN